MKRGLVIVFLGFCLGFPGLPLDKGFAAEDYPSRAINMIVPLPPGGVADMTARPLASAMEPILKQPVVVVNKAGAGGLVGIQSAAVSKPDGYTIMFALASVPVLARGRQALQPTPVIHAGKFYPFGHVDRGSFGHCRA